MLIVAAGCGISFEDNVREADASEFVQECRISFIDSNHFDYPLQTPSVVFIYSDMVEHCRRQASIFNQASALYYGKVMFWAVEESRASLLLDKFGNTGKLPAYIFINQNIAQKLSVDRLSLDEMKECISRHFGIDPII